MARHEEDREDLMREASGLIRRAEWRVSGFDEPVVVGQKRNGVWSIYCGADPVYQFDADGGLRRAFVDGLLYRTQGATLSQLRRQRTETESWLVRDDLTMDEFESFRSHTVAVLKRLLECFERHQVSLLRSIPADGDLEVDFVAVLKLALGRRIALAPAIPGRM